MVLEASGVRRFEGTRRGAWEKSLGHFRNMRGDDLEMCGRDGRFEGVWH